MGFNSGFKGLMVACFVLLSIYDIFYVRGVLTTLATQWLHPNGARIPLYRSTTLSGISVFHLYESDYSVFTLEANV